MLENNIYLDNASTTKMDPRVLEAMLPYFSTIYGNPSSLHTMGMLAKEAVNESRLLISRYLCCDPSEIIFTSGGTESNNFAIKGIAKSLINKGNHIIVSNIEHDCIIESCKELEKEGFIISYANVNSEGILEPSVIENLITPNTILVSVMHVNNEIGTIQPINEIAEICNKYCVLFHTDACQSFGKIPINLKGISLATINAHKIYGPKGIGALYVKKGVNITPILNGGGQEKGLRSTTENVPAIVGFAKAVELCYDNMEQESAKVLGLRDMLYDYLSSSIDNIYFNGSMEFRSPYNINFCIKELEGQAINILFMLDDMGIYVSSGSACSSNKENSASHVLQAIGLNQFEARGAVRVSFSRFNTESDITTFVNVIKTKIKELSPIFSI